MKKTILIFSIGIILVSAILFTIIRQKNNHPIANTVSIENSLSEYEDSDQKDNTPHPDTIPSVASKEFEGGNLQIKELLDENEKYKRHHITYESEGLTISGIMNIPQGNGPFPILFLNHGYINPAHYTNGQGLKREQDFFARNGYIVVHSDYRNHAQSDFDPNNEVRPRTGYVEDVLNAVSSIQNSNLDFIDKEKMGMLGHSMGGGVTLNIMVAKPNLMGAYVLLAPIHANYEENFNRWVKTTWPETAQDFYETYGTKEDNPKFWNDISAINFISKIEAPVMLHQGTADKEFPYTWAHDLLRAFEASNKEITYHEYPNEGHIFYETQNTVMQRSLDFFDKNLKNEK